MAWWLDGRFAPHGPLRCIAHPIARAPHAGNSYWNDLTVSATALINHTSKTAGSAPWAAPYVRLCGGCGGIHSRGIKFGCPNECCFNVSWTGSWMVGAANTTTLRTNAAGTAGTTGIATSGTIAGFKDTWHDISLAIKGGRVTATVDGATIADVANSCTSPGLAGIGTAKYHMAQFRNFSVAGSQ